MRRVILAALGTIAGLSTLLSFKTQAATNVATVPAPLSAPAAPSPSTTTTTKDSERTSGSTTAPSVTSTTSATATQTVTGVAASTRYGPVQVQVTVTNGRVSSVEAVEYPVQSPKDRQINAYAIPRLNAEAVATSNAQIDMVSGATYTSRGYITSLQSALNQAGLA
jgi:uncharacterized protein with FMN-binding domain